MQPLRAIPRQGPGSEITLRQVSGRYTRKGIDERPLRLGLTEVKCHLYWPIILFNSLN